MALLSRTPTDLPQRSMFLTVCLGSLLFLSVALPSGTLIGIPIKHIVYLATVIAIFVQWIDGNVTISYANGLAFVGVLSFTLFFILVGLFHDSTAAGFVLKEATGVFTAISLVIFVAIAVDSETVSFDSVIQWSFYGVFLFAIWKVALVLSLVFGVISYPSAYQFVLEQAGYRLVSSGIFGGLVRINLIIYDYLVAFFMVMLAVSPGSFIRLPHVVRYLFQIVGMACLVFAFSRLLFGFVAFGWLVVFIVRFSTREKLAASLVVVALFSVSASWIYGAAEQRFGSAGSVVSDDIRGEQIVALVDEWSRSPLIGGGFGNYSRKLVRDPMAPFNYEVQWVGFLAKIGTVGVSFLVFLVLVLYFSVFKPPRKLEHYVLVFTLSVFVFGGITNQYLVTSASGVVYSLHLIISRLCRRSSEKQLAAD